MQSLNVAQRLEQVSDQAKRIKDPTVVDADLGSAELDRAIFREIGRNVHRYIVVCVES
jgi:hypothetical protein